MSERAWWRRTPPGSRAFDMGLDGISLCKLPRDDTWASMQNYLEKEKALFPRRAAAAVATLADAIGRFKADVGEYPRALDELVKKPSRLAAKKGVRPYFLDDRIQLGPSGQ